MNIIITEMPDCKQVVSAHCVLRILRENIKINLFIFKY